MNRSKLIYEMANLHVAKGDLLLSEAETEYSTIKREVDALPDIVIYLQNETQLTRRSILQILQGCSNLKSFKVNRRSSLKATYTLSTSK